jgi:hypothetical protein
MFARRIARSIVRTRPAVASALAASVCGGACTPFAATTQPLCTRRTAVSDATRGMNKDRLSQSNVDTAIFRRLTERDFNEIDRIYTAYLEYFNHIKFRKGWDTPKYKKEEVDMPFREAAEYVFRIRQHLDRGKAEGETTLRLLDGESQKFLQADAGPRLLKSDQASFVAHLVHASVSDARGYVEGLSADSVNQLVGRLQKHRFSPAEHLRHVLLEALENVSAVDIQPLDESKPLDFVEENSDEDRSWRAAINSAYDAAEAAAKAQLLRAKSIQAAEEAEAKAAKTAKRAPTTTATETAAIDANAASAAGEAKA